MTRAIQPINAEYRGSTAPHDSFASQLVAGAGESGSSPLVGFLMFRHLQDNRNLGKLWQER
jgi:hypothetical protein